MIIIAATEFARNFRTYNLRAQTEPVKVTNHGKIDGAYISAQDLEILEAAKLRMRKRYTAGNIPEDTMKTIMEARVPDIYANIHDDLGIDWSKIKIVTGTEPAPRDKD